MPIIEFSYDNLIYVLLYALSNLSQMHCIEATASNDIHFL